MTEHGDLAAFLLARIAEDEQWAKDAAGQWGNPYAEGEDRFDTARVLAEVEAKRRIVEVHGLYRFRDGTLYCWTCASFDSEGEPIGGAGYPCKTLRLLALPYAGHSEYRQEWAP